MYEHWRVEEQIQILHQERIPFTEAERLRYEFLEEQDKAREGGGLLGRIVALFRPAPEVMMARNREDVDLIAAVGLPAGERRVKGRRAA